MSMDGVAGRRDTYSGFISEDSSFRCTAMRQTIGHVTPKRG